MGDLNDRRAQKKARTRAHVRAVAHQMFADRGFDTVTIVDIARGADVAVQTVFNHFSTKEELFFDGRAPWVTGPADAVRDRPAGTAPLTALQNYLVALVRGKFGAMAVESSLTYLRTIETSEALLARERELVHESERLLTAALHEAWTTDVRADDGPPPHDPATAATLTAATWLAAVRSLIVGQRTRVHQGACPHEIAENLGRLAEQLFDAVMSVVPDVEARASALPPVDWPVRHAG
ncbi:TetR/AcrR family transcriptional regulator [Blastococcus sp. TF02A-35]|uniref:TetR/AcrR family transcriptional regulator n=1 Tax=Blastococcus sp. TF02A-35 TaxID=2559612 RepID=UPI0010740A86|nr:TetR/AcrR family transcriptional regulator [Blastococcus sp. TF02A_35]TFV53737.1 TetR/AcrR family transcriptional regulator [Blastococcus sp. TF02A_35]